MRHLVVHFKFELNPMDQIQMVHLLKLFVLQITLVAFLHSAFLSDSISYLINYFVSRMMSTL